MLFTTLKHKTKPNTFAEPYCESLDDGFELRETPVPLLQPNGVSKENIRKAYEEGPHPAEKAIAQLEDYELVTVFVSVVENEIKN